MSLDGFKEYQEFALKRQTDIKALCEEHPEVWVHLYRNLESFYALHRPRFVADCFQANTTPIQNSLPPTPRELLSRCSTPVLPLSPVLPLPDELCSPANRLPSLKLTPPSAERRTSGISQVMKQVLSEKFQRNKSAKLLENNISRPRSRSIRATVQNRALSKRYGLTKAELNRCTVSQTSSARQVQVSPSLAKIVGMYGHSTSDYDSPDQLAGPSSSRISTVKSRRLPRYVDDV